MVYPLKPIIRYLHPVSLLNFRLSGVEDWCAVSCKPCCHLPPKVYNISLKKMIILSAMQSLIVHFSAKYGLFIQFRSVLVICLIGQVNSIKLLP
jgi:hypothetical protein